MKDIMAVVVGLLAFGLGACDEATDSNLATPDTPTSWNRRSGAFLVQSARDGNDELYLFGPDYAERNLTNHPAPDQAGVFSPDGTRIAWQTRRDGNWEIYVMSTDGTNVRNLTSSPSADRNPGWSPDGRQIAWDSDRRGAREVWVMNADGTEPKAIASKSSGEWWSPEQRLIHWLPGPSGMDRGLSFVAGAGFEPATFGL